MSFTCEECGLHHPVQLSNQEGHVQRAIKQKHLACGRVSMRLQLRDKEDPKRITGEEGLSAASATRKERLGKRVSRVFSPGDKPATSKQFITL